MLVRVRLILLLLDSQADVPVHRNLSRREKPIQVVRDLRIVRRKPMNFLCRKNHLRSLPRYLALIGRIMPMTMNIKTDTKVTVEYGTMEEKRQALIERGFDPDAIERAMQPKFLLEHQKEPTE